MEKRHVVVAVVTDGSVRCGEACPFLDYNKVTGVCALFGFLIRAVGKSFDRHVDCRGFEVGR